MVMPLLWRLVRVPLHNSQYEAAGGDIPFYRKGDYVVNAAQKVLNR